MTSKRVKSDIKVREMTDDITNEAMDVIRDEFNLDSDSDRDDQIYSRIWNAIYHGLMETRSRRLKI
jgi:hypothetical protein